MTNARFLHVTIFSTEDQSSEQPNHQSSQTPGDDDQQSLLCFFFILLIADVSPFSFIDRRCLSINERFAVAVFRSHLTQS